MRIFLITFLTLFLSVSVSQANVKIDDSSAITKAREKATAKAEKARASAVKAERSAARASKRAAKANARVKAAALYEQCVLKATTEEAVERCSPED